MRLRPNCVVVLSIRILRDVGATLKFEDCDFSEENGFIDQICSTAEDLEPLNCKRSKFETTVN